MKHTPGPWNLSGRTVYTLHRLAHMETNRWSAQVQGYVDCPAEEADANARLIAAAPELLEALCDAREELRLIRMKDTVAVYDPTVRIRIDAVIAKAKGES